MMHRSARLRSVFEIQKWRATRNSFVSKLVVRQYNSGHKSYSYNHKLLNGKFEESLHWINTMMTIIGPFSDGQYL